jgi:tRNA (adenine37-N6)-methyltransferase
VVTNKVSDTIDDGTEEAIFNEEVYPEIADLPNQVVYHLILEGIDISYRIDSDSNVVVEKANVHPDFANKSRYKFLEHRDKAR